MPDADLTGEIGACPCCGADLRNGPYFRTIGVEVRGVYDGVLFWRCPDCDGVWHRFPEGHWLRPKADAYLGTEGGYPDPFENTPARPSKPK